MDIPLLRPQPPSLRKLHNQLAEIETSRIYSNFGPVNTRFERELTQVIEGTSALESAREKSGGACVTVCNATIGLILAIRAAIDRGNPLATSSRPARRYALMPAFTFAAAAHAAEWCGLTPLLCDINPDDWSASQESEEELIAQYGSDIAVIVPYATFGNCIDLRRYEALSVRTGIPVVVDAAASLGSLDENGRPFGSGSTLPIVFSMHATKTFGIGEGGVIYSTDRSLIDTIRLMANFGFGEPRSATTIGLNAKLSEVSALLALTRLRDFETDAARQSALADMYHAALGDWQFQASSGQRCAFQFMPVLLPSDSAISRDALISGLHEHGIGAGAYFSPHLGEQPHFRRTSVRGSLSVCDAIGKRVLALPMWKGMTEKTIAVIAATLRELTRHEPAVAVRALPAHAPMTEDRVQVLQ